MSREALKKYIENNGKIRNGRKKTLREYLIEQGRIPPMEDTDDTDEVDTSGTVRSSAASAMRESLTDTNTYSEAAKRRQNKPVKPEKPSAAERIKEGLENIGNAISGGSIEGNIRARRGYIDRMTKGTAKLSLDEATRRADEIYGTEDEIRAGKGKQDVTNESQQQYNERLDKYHEYVFAKANSMNVIEENNKFLDSIRNMQITNPDDGSTSTFGRLLGGDDGLEHNMYWMKLLQDQNNALAEIEKATADSKDYSKFVEAGSKSKDNIIINTLKGLSDIRIDENGIVTASDKNRRYIELTEKENRIVNMTNDEKAQYTYILGAYGKDEAQAYFEKITPEIDSRIASARMNLISDVSNKHKIMGGIINVGSSLGGGVMPMVTETKTAAKDFLTGRHTPENPYQRAFIPQQTQAATREGITRDMGTFGKTATDIALSTANSAVNMPLGMAGLINMSLNAGANTVYEKELQGISRGDALKYGVVSGAIEYATEKLPFDMITDMFSKSVSKASARTLFKSALLSAGAEGGEEAVNNIANNLAERWILKDKSEYEQYVKELTDKGMSRKDAEKEAFKKFMVSDTVKSALMGAASGGLMSGAALGVRGAVGVYDNAATGRAIQRQGSEAVSRVIESGLDQEKDTTAYKNAEKLNTKIENNEDYTPSAYTIGRQANLNTLARMDYDTAAGLQRVQNAVADKIRESAAAAPANTENITTANTRFISKPDSVFDVDFVTDYAKTFTDAMAQSNSLAHRVLSEQTENLAGELARYVTTGESALSESQLFRDSADRFKGVLKTAVNANYLLHNRTYERSAELDAQRAAVNNGDFSVLARTPEANTQTTAAEPAARYSIQTDAAGNTYVNIDEDILEGVPENEYKKTVRDVMRERFSSPIVTDNGDVSVTRQSRNEYTYSKYTQNISNAIRVDKFRMANNLDEIIQTQNNIRTENLNHTRNDNIVRFERGDVNVKVGNNGYTADVVVGVTDTGRKVFYDVINLDPINIKGAGSVSSASTARGSSPSNGFITDSTETAPSDTIISNSDENVNTNPAENVRDIADDQIVPEGDRIPGLLRDEYSARLSSDEIRAIDELATLCNVTVKIVPSVSEGRANGCYKDGVIYIAEDAEDKPMAVFSHEITHHFEGAAPESYADYRKAVFDVIAEDSGVSIDEQIDGVIEIYAQSGVELTREEAESELAADYTREILADADKAMELVNRVKGLDEGRKRGILQNLARAIRELIGRIKSRISGNTAAREHIARAEKASAALERMIAEASGNPGVNTSGTRYSFAGKNARTAAQTGDTKYNVEKNSGQYDYTKPFSQQVDDYKNGLIPQYDTLIVGGTSDVLKNIGFNPLPITINQTHVDYALNGTKDIDHTIGEAMLKQLPRSLENPVAIIKSKTQGSNRVVALLDFVHNGKNVVAPVEIDGYGRQNNIIIDSNAITSIYGKNNVATGLLSDALNDEQAGNTAVFYLDNKKATALLQKAGLQLPSVLFRNDGYIHSIREQGSDVKPKFENVTYTQQFKRWFGDWENNPHTASKVVNADGTPKVVYHGSTQKGISVFRPSENGALGKGIYFSEMEEFAKGFTVQNGKFDGEIYSVYLDIKKPFIAEYPGVDTEKIKKQGYDGVYSPTNKMWVAFSPTQIKSATDNIGTFDAENADIRYSLNNKSNIANTLINTYGVRGRVDAAAINDGIREIAAQIYDAYYKGDVAENYSKLEAKARSIAVEIADAMRNTDDAAAEEYSRLRKEIKSARISVSDDAKADFPDWNDFRKRNFGYLTIVKDGIPIDSYYKELAEQYPQYFDENAHVTQSDQLQHIVDTLESLRPQEYRLSGDEYDAAVEELIGEIMTIAANNAEMPQERTYSADEHTPEQQRVIDEYEAAVDDNMTQFLKNVYNGENTKYEYKIGVTNERFNNTLKNGLGIDTTGYAHYLAPDAVEHIKEEHGKNGKTDHSMNDIDDLKRIGYVIENYDHAYKTSKVSKKYKDKDNNFAPIILLTKKIDGHYIVAEAVPDSQKKRVHIVSAYKNKTSEVQNDLEKSLHITPNSELPNNVPADNIPQREDDVKTEFSEDEYNRLRKEIKSTRISASDETKAAFPNWNEFRRRNFGNFTITQDGIPIDSFYRELTQKYPQYFGEYREMTQAEQLKHIADTLAGLRPQMYKRLDAQRRQLTKKSDAKLQKQRARFEEQQRKLKEKISQQKERARERRKEAEDRQRLLKIARRLNGMRTSPENLAKIPDILRHIDTTSLKILETGYTTADGKRVMGRTDLQELKKRYLDIAETDPDFLPEKNAKAKNIEDKIKRLDKIQIGDMDIEQVRELVETLLEVEHEIKTHDKLINDAKNRAIAETAVQSIREIRKSWGKGKNPLSKFMNMYNTWLMSPMRMFRRLSGYQKDGAFESLGKALDDGQRKSLDFQMRASNKFDALIAEKDNIKKFTGKGAELIDISQYDTKGRKVYITPAMRTALYLHSKNNAALRHIAYGGITVPDMKEYKKGHIAAAYKEGGMIIRLTPEQVRSIVSDMSDYEKRFAETAYKFFNEDCKDAINETSLALDGYEKATVKEYFPIVANKHFVHGKFESLVKDGSIEGKGILKERKLSTNPIVLEDVTKVITRHLDDVGKYYGLAVPIRNFDAVYHFTEGGYEDGTEHALDQKWGVQATRYIENMMADLQSGRQPYGDDFEKVFTKLKSNYAGAVLVANAGVTLTQAGSYPTAAAVLGYGPLIKAFGEKVTAEDRKIIDKYTPYLHYRSRGYTNSEIGDYAKGSSNDWAKNLPALWGWIQAMDIATTTKLWKASEFYVRDNFKDYKQESDAYYKKVAEIYERVILETQPNYTTMQRPDILRSPSPLTRSITMFTTQPFQNRNLIYDSYGELRARLTEYKRGEGSKAEVNKAVRQMGLTISANIVAALVIGACKALGRATKGQLKKYYYDKDKDEPTLDSVIKQYLTDVLDVISGTELFGSEMVLLVKGLLGKFGIGEGARWYDIDMASLSVINDLASETMSFFDKTTRADSDRKTVLTAMNKMAKVAAKALGLPLENVENLLLGAYNNIVDVLDDEGVIRPGVINRKNLDYNIQKLIGDSGIDGVSQDRAKELERLEDAQQEDGFKKDSDKEYITYDGKTYELTRKQAAKLNTETNKRAGEYYERLMNGEPVEDVFKDVSKNGVTVQLYAEEMTDKQYNDTVRKLNQKIQSASKPETQIEARQAKQDFLDGKTKKQITVTGNYNDLPDKLRSAVQRKANTVAAKEIEDEMRGEIEQNAKLVQTEPTHERE